MKRKFKILSSIACLCLAVAALVVGVYAATTVSYTITNSVTYTLSDVLVNVQTNVYTSTTKFADAATMKASNAYTKDESASSSFITYDATTNIANSTNGTQTKTIDMNFNTYKAYKIEIIVSTVNDSGVKVAATAPTLASGANLLLSADAAVAKPSTANCTTSKTFTYTYYVGLDNAAKAIGSNVTNLFSASCQIDITL